MTTKLTPEDFPTDLTNQDLVEIELELRARLIDEEIW